MKETHLSAEKYGFIVSAFSIAYMISNPLWGVLLDRLGLRIGMTAAVSFWTAASVAHAFATGFRSFAIAKAGLLGVGEGATFPGGLRAVVQTLRPEEQSRGLAVAYSGGSLGAIVTPFVIMPIFVKWGWRPAFLFTGGIGLAWLAVWSVVSRRPDIRDWKPPVTGKPAALPRFNDPRMWSFHPGVRLGRTALLGFVMYAAAIYRSQALGKDQVFIGKVLWIPPLGWEVGYFLWGWIMDRMTAAGVPRTTAVRRLMLSAMFLSLPLAAVPWMTSGRGWCCSKCFSWRS